MGKQYKSARVRYVSNDPHLGESLRLEIYTKEDGWGLVCAGKFHKSTEFPNESEAEFVHCDLLLQVCKLAEMGYNVRYVGEIKEEA